MWRNYWTIAVRVLAKNKTYSIINIAGLAIGMAACILILLYVQYETSYDTWIPDVRNTYELQAWYPHPHDSDPLFLQMSAYVTKNRVKKDFPEVERSVYAWASNPVFVKDGQALPTDHYLIADDDFLKVVNLPLTAGTTLSAAQTAVITQTEARNRFGTDQVVGRTMSLISKGVTRDFLITGVLRDLPKNSSLKINGIIRVDYNSFWATTPTFFTCWDCQAGYVFLKVRPGTDIQQLQVQEPAWEKRNVPDQPNGGVRWNAGDEEDWHFVNLANIHLGKAQGGSMTPGNDEKTVATFVIIALLILGMAIVNFTNLTTARAGHRAREIALRKVVGATRKQLVVQFVAESILISVIAMLLALTLVELLARPFGAFLDSDVALDYFGPRGMLFPAIGLAVLVGVISGLYPALFLSGFQPAQVLKANRSASDTPGSGRIRAALVIVQFAVSIGLIACTAVIYNQTAYARSVDPGYKRDHILQVDNMQRAQLLPKGEAIVEQMKRVPGAVAVGRSDIGVATDNSRNANLIPPGSTNQVTIGQYNVDAGFFDAMGLKLIAGRWFDSNRPADDSTILYPPDPNFERTLAQRGVNVVMNQYAVKKLGFRSPQDALGKVVRSELFDPGTGMVNITIIGVVGDSRFRTVRTPIDPIMFMDSKQGERWMIIRYRGDPATVAANVQRQWKQIVYDVPFEAKFSEDIIRELYSAEEARAEIFGVFSVIAVIIGCLGLFGLAAFTVERRTKEIGIRKVLGARTRDIVRLLVWQFSRPVMIANVIAWPAAWWLMRDWLNGFDQRIALTALPFVLAGVIAFGIAIATVVGHAVKVARASPIHALRFE